MISIDKLNKLGNEDLEKLIQANKKKIKSLNAEIQLFEKLKKANQKNENADLRNHENAVFENDGNRF